MRMLLSAVLILMLIGSFSHAAPTDAARTTTSRQHLDGGDFSELNQVLQSLMIRSTEPTSFTQTVAFVSLTVTMDALVCHDMHVEDLLMSVVASPDEAVHAVALQVIDLDLSCTVDYRIQYGVVPETSGTATTTLTDSHATFQIGLVQQETINSSHVPPYVRIEQGSAQCSTELNVDVTLYLSPVLEMLLNVVEAILQEFLRDQWDRLLCEQFTTAGVPAMQQGLASMDGLLEPYVNHEETGTMVVNVMQPERDIQDMLDNGTVIGPLVDWSSTDKHKSDTAASLSFWASTALHQLDASLGQPIRNNDQDDDLAMAVLLRQFLLDQQGQLVVNSSHFGIWDMANNNMDQQGNSSSNKTTAFTTMQLPTDMADIDLHLQQITLHGLDSISNLRVWNSRGAYTGESFLVWKNLSLDVQFGVQIRRSSLTNNNDDNSRQLQSTALEFELLHTHGHDVLLADDTIHVHGSLQDLQIILTTMLPVYQRMIDAIPMTALLDPETLASCLASTLVVPADWIAGWNVTMAGISDLQVQGFVAPGLDRVLTKSLQLGLDLYHDQLRAALPSVFHTTVRPLVNQYIREAMSSMFTSSGSSCPSPDNVNSFGRNTSHAALEGKRLLNFTGTQEPVDGKKPSYSLSDLIAMLLPQARRMLRIEEGDEQRNRAILQNMLRTDSNGVFRASFNHTMLVDPPSVQLRMDALTVAGLDSLASLDLFATNMEGPQILDNRIQLQHLAINISLSIVSPLAQDASFMLSLQADHVEAFIPIFTAIDLDLLETLQLGSLLQTSNILPCLLSTVLDLQITTDMTLSVGAFDLSVHHILPESLGIFEEMIAGALKAFSRAIQGSLSSITRGLFNSFIMSIVDQATCPDEWTAAQTRQLASAEADPSDWIDFRDLLLDQNASLALGGTGLAPYGDLFNKAMAFVYDMTDAQDPDTDLSMINQILPESILVPLNEIFDQVQQNVQVGGLDALITFRPTYFKATNLNTLFAPLSILAPMHEDPFQLKNNATVGFEERPLRLCSRIFFSLQGDDDVQMSNDFQVCIELEEARALLIFLLHVGFDKLAAYPLRDIGSLDCWMATIPAPELNNFGIRKDSEDLSAGVTSLDASVAAIRLNLSCFNCSSPGLHELSDFWTQDEVSVDLTGRLNGALDYLISILQGELLQFQIDRLLNQAPLRCPYSDTFDPAFVEIQYQMFETTKSDTSMSYLVMAVIVAASFLLFAVLVSILVRWLVRRRHQRWLRSLTDEQLFIIHGQQQNEEGLAKELDAVTSSMFESSGSIPPFVRWCIPAVIVANIALFLSGHLSLGATIDVIIVAGDERVKFNELFQFSMAKSTIDIWNSGGRALAALLFIFSGLWPYTKQAVSLALWFLPPSRVPMKTRGSILEWLDILAKFSMLDIFALLFSLSAFRITVDSSDVGFLPTGFYTAELSLVPMWGLYANLIAQLLSQVSSHFIIFYHRKVARNADRARRALKKTVSTFLEDHCDFRDDSFTDEQTMSTKSTDAPTRTRLCQHAFQRPHRIDQAHEDGEDGSKVIVRDFVNPGIVATAVGIVVLIIAGCFLSSFSVELFGLLGLLVESSKSFEQAKTYHSVFTMAGLLFDQAGSLQTAQDYVGLGSLAVILIATVLLVPMLQTCALLYQWFTPMSKPSMTKVASLIEVLSAWQYSEIYLLALFVSCWQLGTVSEFMINVYCEGFRETFGLLVEFGILREEDAQCFRVEAAISAGAYVLAAGSLLLLLLKSFIGMAVRQQKRDLYETPRFLAPSLRTAGTQRHISGAKEKPLLVAGDVAEFFQDENDKDIDDKDRLVGSMSRRPEDWSRQQALEDIHPVAVGFSDAFRWFLQSSATRKGEVVIPEGNSLLQDAMMIEMQDLSSSLRPVD